MNRIPRYASILFVLLFQLFFENNEAYSQSLVIAVEDDAAPWSQKDGKGFANDVVREAFKAVGQDIQLLVVPYSRAKEMVLGGKVAACFTMAGPNEKEFKGKVTFPKMPLFTCISDFYTKKQNMGKIKSLSGLKKGTVVGTVFGYEYPPSVYKLRDQGILVFEESESEEINLKKLAMGRIPYALLNYNETKPAELLLTRAGVQNKVGYAFSGGIQKCYIGFSNRHPQSKKALEQFNKGMQLISANGTLKKIEKEWMNRAQMEINKIQVNSH